MKLRCLFSVLAILTSTRAQEVYAGPADRPHLPARVRVDVQMVAVAQREAARLIPAFANPRLAGEAWNRLQEMIARNEATLVAWPIVWLQDGEEGFDTSDEELRYPTEMFDIHGMWSRPILSPTWDPFTPTAFATRNLGPRLDAQVDVEPGGQVVAVDFDVKFVRLVGQREWRGQKSPLGIVSWRRQPEFQTAHVSTGLRVRRDEPVLIGTYLLPEPKPHVELHILHARATLLPASVPAVPRQ